MVAAGASDDVGFDLSNRGTGDYVLAVETGEATVDDDADCPSVVRFQGVGGVPALETLRVTVNGEQVHRIDAVDSFAEHRPLPEPIPANGSQTP